MSLFQDPQIVIAGCKLHKKKYSGDTHTAPANISPLRSLLKYANLPSLSSIVARAGCELNSYRDGLSREEREEKSLRDVKRRLLQLGIRDVSSAEHSLLPISVGTCLFEDILTLCQAASFDEWYEHACGLDELEDNNTWKSAFESDDYDPYLVQSRLLELEDARISCDAGRMLFLLGLR